MPIYNHNVGYAGNKTAGGCRKLIAMFQCCLCFLGVAPHTVPQTISPHVSGFVSPALAAFKIKKTPQGRYF